MMAAPPADSHWRLCNLEVSIEYYHWLLQYKMGDLEVGDLGAGDLRAGDSGVGDLGVGDSGVGDSEVGDSK